MKSILSALLRIFAQVAPSLVTLAGVSGPLGWALGLGIKFTAGYLVDWADKMGIEGETVTRIKNFHVGANAFFKLQDKIKAGEPVSNEEKAAAEKRYKDVARALIRINRN